MLTGCPSSRNAPNCTAYFCRCCSQGLGSSRGKGEGEARVHARAEDQQPREPTTLLAGAGRTTALAYWRMTPVARACLRFCSGSDALSQLVSQTAVMQLVTTLHSQLKRHAKGMANGFELNSFGPAHRIRVYYYSILKFTETP